jgi:2-iminobutanoate/2-iminopropanoate deaminase
MDQKTHTRRYIKREATQVRAYSPAVITEGGRTVWLAGVTVLEDAAGKSLAGDFDAQVREVFARLGKTLEEAGGKLADMVTMTVFITDGRYGDRFTQLRRETISPPAPSSPSRASRGPACSSRSRGLPSSVPDTGWRFLRYRTVIRRL